MKLKNLNIIGLSALIFATSASTSLAQDVSSTPVGYMSHTISDNSDYKLGVVLHQSVSFTGTVSAITGTSITLSADAGDLTTDRHYLIVTSDGSAKGYWSEVSASNADIVTTVEDLEAEGLAVGDSVQAVPFWTLGTLFSGGEGIAKSSDFSNIQSFVLLNDLSVTGQNKVPTGVYYYLDDSYGAEFEGWYDNSTSSPANDVVISPETFITIRNVSGADLVTTIAGTVPTVASSSIRALTTVEDNLVTYPYPAGTTLANLGLIEDGVVRESSDFSNPVDYVLLYSATQDSINPVPTAVYYYLDDTYGAEFEGWYDNSSSSPANDVSISSGAAIVIRRGAGASAESLTWTPDAPYTL